MALLSHCFNRPMAQKYRSEQSYLETEVNGRLTRLDIKTHRYRDLRIIATRNTDAM